MKTAQQLWRVGFYSLGMVFLALGITLNTKTGMGVSPIISLPNGVSVLFGTNLGNTIAAFYVLFVALQLVLKGKRFTLLDLLQAPLSVLFTRLINLFNAGLDFSAAPLSVRLLLLAAAVAFTGMGMALTVGMELIPNAADGLVGAISRRFHLEMGLTKNLFDLASVGLTVVLSLSVAGHVVGVGLGTLMTVLLTGRVVAWFNLAFRRKMRCMAGLEGKVA